ncbi:class I SAM-dependent methyltransferase [bacterium]|nr:class I SAM-dependent methyltransferase [bacterium]
MTISESLCRFLNIFFKKPHVPSRESAILYSESEYNSAEKKLALYKKHIEFSGTLVLDAGCGLGGRTVFYSEKGSDSVIGIDIDQEHISHSKEFADKRNVKNVHFLVGNLNNLPFKSNVFDIILLNDVIEHIRRPYLMSSFAEIKRVIKVKGKICLEFPPWTNAFAAHLYDYIYIPWCHLLFSSSTLINVINNHNPNPQFGKLSRIEHFNELNRIVISEFLSILSEVGFKVIHYECKMIKNLRFLHYLPWLNQYLTSRVVAVLSK